MNTQNVRRYIGRSLSFRHENSEVGVDDAAATTVLPASRAREGVEHSSSSSSLNKAALGSANIERSIDTMEP